MGIFASISKTSASRERGKFLAPGQYVVEVVSCRHLKAKIGTDEFFVADFEILESTNGENPVGSMGTWMAKLTGKYVDMALADIKAFIIAATGAAEDIIDEEFIANEVLGGDGSAMAGEKVRVVVEAKTTRAGTTFNKASFRAV